MKRVLPTLDGTPLPAAHGGTLAVRGERLAAASRARLSVWPGLRSGASWQSPVPAEGTPVWLDAGLCWGPGRAVRDDEPWQASPELLARAPPPQWTPRHWSWRADGQELLLTAATEVGDGLRVLATRASAEGATLAQWPALDADDSPTLLGAALAVLGHRQAAVHALDGRPLVRLGNAGPALRLSFCGSQEHVPLVEAGRIAVYGLESAAAAATWSGTWIDAAAAPDGRWLLAVDVHGGLAQLDVHDAAAPPRGWAAPDPLQSVATDGVTVLADCRSGPLLRRAGWLG